MLQLRAILPGEPSFDWQGNIRPLSGEHAEAVGAYEGDALVGSLAWRTLADRVYLVATFVKPEYRSQGVFQRMLKYVTTLHPDMPLSSDSEEGSPVKTLQDTHNYHLLRGVASWKEAAVPPEVQQAFSQGHGAAFWYYEGQIYWGSTHYKIFEDLFGKQSLDNVYDHQKLEQGIFGWVFEDWDDWEGVPSYSIDFGTDFGYGANKNNMSALKNQAAKAVQKQMGNPPANITAGYSEFEREAGHDYEPDDLLHDTSSSCFGCGNPVSDDICGNCGHENMMWWTGNGEGLQHFKGSWEEDLQFSRLAALDKVWSIRYNTKTADAWNEAFNEPIVDEDLGDFEQETSFMTEQEKQENGIEGPFTIDGWTVYTKDCDNQYPTHDAIWMDRGKKIMAIGWQGGHGHLFDGPLFHLTANGSPYDQTTGHFRQAPSTTEPFPAGWGWHGSQGTKEERNILKKIIKDHYGVNTLKELYKPDENAEEDYFDVGNDDEIDPHAAAVKALQELTKQQIYDIIKVKQTSQGV